MKKLLEEMEKNAVLKAKIEELDKNPKSTIKDYIQAAAECGLELQEEDFKPERLKEELEDSELDAVAGGHDCGCVFGGGGEASKNDGVCFCMVGGGGEYTGKAREAGATRCVCVVAGSGVGDRY